MRHSAFHLPETPVLDIGEPTERELQALDRLQRYDCLTSLHLFDGIGDKGRVYKDLLKAQAIGIPEYFRDYARRKNVYYPLELFPIGAKALARAGRWIGRDRGPDHPAHKIYRSTIEFFFDEAAKPHSLSVKTLEDWLDDDRCPAIKEGTEHKLPLSQDMKGRWHYLVPDFLRGLHLDLGDVDATMNFYGEADRATEPGRTEEVRQTLRIKLAQYDEHFAKGGPEKRYGFKSVTVLWLTTTETNKKKLLGHIKQSKNPQRHAVKVFPDYKEFPPLTDMMVSQPWERAEGGPLDILKTLRETAERKRNGLSKESEPRHRVVAGN